MRKSGSEARKLRQVSLQPLGEVVLDETFDESHGTGHEPRRGLAAATEQFHHAGNHLASRGSALCVVEGKARQLELIAFEEGDPRLPRLRPREVLVSCLADQAPSLLVASEKVSADEVNEADAGGEHRD